MICDENLATIYSKTNNNQIIFF